MFTVTLLQVKAQAVLAANVQFLVVPLGNTAPTSHLLSKEPSGPVFVDLPQPAREQVKVLTVGTVVELLELCLEPGEQSRPLFLPLHASLSPHALCP